MPVTVTPPSAAPSAAVEIDNGVIEEARRRQRRRRTAGMALGGSAVVIALSALLIGGGGGGKPDTSGASSPGSPLEDSTLSHGRVFVGSRPALMGVTPSLQAGNVGVCVRVVEESGCNGPPPTAAYPVYGGGEAYRQEEQVGPDGEIDAIFTGPGVAAMRVARLGAFKAEPAPGLPPGAKQIVFYRPRAHAARCCRRGSVPGSSGAAFRTPGSALR